MKELIKPQNVENEYLNAEAYCENFYYDGDNAICHGVSGSGYLDDFTTCHGFSSDNENEDLLF